MFNKKEINRARIDIQHTRDDLTEKNRFQAITNTAMQKRIYSLELQISDLLAHLNLEYSKPDERPVLKTKESK
jgi:pyrimidine operon attenuation protein/uracil phosphoribosyltransferase